MIEVLQLTPTIYFLCYDINIPSGGIKVLYQHVDILNRSGFRAFIVHQKPGFRCSWFDNNTAVAYAALTEIGLSDYLVIPEQSFSEVSRVIRGVKKVVFNQGCYCTFRCGYSLNKNDISTPYRDKELVAALVVSEDSRRYLSYVFPELHIVRMHNAIDASLFSYNVTKKPVISFMTRKNTEDILQVINILKFRRALDGFEIEVIDNRTEREVAEILKNSLIFLSSGYTEGFSLPPAEAMACGCIVIGYHGMGGTEFFKPKFCYPIVNGKIIAFAQTVEKVIELYKHDNNVLKEKGQLASQYVLKNYSVEQQEKDVIQFWRNVTS